MRIQANKIQAMSVLTKDGRELGSVRTMILDTEDWNVTSLSVRLDRDLVSEFGMSRKIFGGPTIDVPAEYVATVGDTILLTTTLNELENTLGQATKPAAEEEPAAEQATYSPEEARPGG